MDARQSGLGGPWGPLVGVGVVVGWGALARPAVTASL